MTRVAILYATREGQTHRIAEHVAAALRAHGLVADVQDVRQLPHDFTLSDHAAVIVAASVHMGHHEREMVAFVKAHRVALESMPAAFLSVSLSQAGAEGLTQAPELKDKSAADVRRVIDAFFTETGWHPTHVKPIAGALAYQHYGALKRVVMRMIAKKTGADTDTSHDHEYTDWEALDRFVGEMAEQIETF